MLSVQNYKNKSLHGIYANGLVCLFEGSIRRSLFPRRRFISIVTGIYVLRQRTRSEFVMLYMIIERFHPHQLRTLYQRFDEKGRMLPEGVRYINSWIDENVTVCYQVMESESVEKLQEWVGRWNDLADFEIIPLITSAQAKEKVLGKH